MVLLKCLPMSNEGDGTPTGGSSPYPARCSGWHSHQRYFPLPYPVQCTTHQWIELQFHDLGTFFLEDVTIYWSQIPAHYRASFTIILNSNFMILVHYFRSMWLFTLPTLYFTFFSFHIFQIWSQINWGGLKCFHVHSILRERPTCMYFLCWRDSYLVSPLLRTGI